MDVRFLVFLLPRTMAPFLLQQRLIHAARNKVDVSCRPDMRSLQGVILLLIECEKAFDRV